MTTTRTAKLAAFAAGLRYEDIPQPVRAATRRAGAPGLRLHRQQDGTAELRAGRGKRRRGLGAIVRLGGGRLVHAREHHGHAEMRAVRQP